jgi:hypothetical protein
MAEWLYAQAGQLVQVDPKLWFGLLNPTLQVPTEAFGSSIERLRKFWELSPHMMEVTAANIKAQHDFIFEAGTTYQVPSTEEEFNKLMVEEITKRVAKKFEQTGSLKEATGYDLERGIKAFDEFLKRTTTLDGAVRSVLESQITLTWTAFEILSEDLWKAIQALYPQCVTLKPHFRRLESIRETYKDLSPTSNEINAILARSELRKLSLVRNLLIHKSGKVDQQFLDGVAEISWGISDPRDQLIDIHGGRVKELLNPVIDAAQELILAVDQWMTAKKKSTP